MKIGILGSGQLGRMMFIAGAPLELDFLIFDTVSGTPTKKIIPHSISTYDNIEAIKEFAMQCDVVTTEFENVSVDAIAEIEKIKPFFPARRAVEIAQDRFKEKTFLNNLGIKTANYLQINAVKDLTLAKEKLGFPFILKTQTQGYDGKGQYVIKNDKDLEDVKIHVSQNLFIAEGFLKFDREVSLVCATDQNENSVFYPLSENVHRNGILHTSKVVQMPTLQKKAEEIARKIISSFSYVGVLTIEFFVHGDQLIVNELAPRVHNSGHWSIEGSMTSQFANHVRAIAGLPLGSTAARGHVAMINILSQKPDIKKILAIPNVFLHLYDKGEKANRKLGHVTIVEESEQEINNKIRMIEDLIKN